MFINSFVSVRDELLIFREGTYRVGTTVPEGEYYFWGNQIRYEGISNGETLFWEEGSNEKYDIIHGNYSIRILKGQMTPASNLIYHFDSGGSLIPGHIYKVGCEVPYGCYLATGASKHTKIQKYNLQIFPPLLEYTSELRRCEGYADTIKIEEEAGFICLLEGKMWYNEKGEIQVHEAVKKTLISPDHFNQKGIEVLSTKSISIRLYKWIPSSLYISEDQKTTFYIYDQYFYSVNNLIFWYGRISPIAIRSDASFYGTLIFENTQNNRSITIGTDEAVRISVRECEYCGESAPC